jgi:hypothetical protein
MRTLRLFMRDGNSDFVCHLVFYKLSFFISRSRETHLRLQPAARKALCSALLSASGWLSWTGISLKLFLYRK